jgi:hypothetical protein
MSLKFDSSGNKTTQNEKLSSDEEYIYSSSDGEGDTWRKEEEKGECKKQDDIPEYRKITNDNMYEFIIWANEKRNRSIEGEHFNMILNSNVCHWVQKNNITWQYGLTLVIDIINNQKNIDLQFDISNNGVDGTADGREDELIKPNSAEERRQLFAAAAEKRAAKKF